jgi:hypothetical protein
MGWIALATTIALPVAAILVPSLIAISLARTERKAAAMARLEERRDVLLEGVIESLGPFITVDPLREFWTDELRKLRARVTILQTMPDSDLRLVGRWLAAEIPIGL